jgi:murein DD-endopeptidase MepM/ murein hydrolase activator NlpD
MRRDITGAAALTRPIAALSLTLALAAGCDAPTSPNAAEPFEGTIAYSHGDFGESFGIYRIPYANGTSVGVTNDVHNHNNAYDMSAGVGASIVAAASGWIRAIVENHGNEPNAGDGLDALGNPYADPNAGDALEHACLSNDPANTVPAGTICSDYNNYVWIEHPNGEYTKYSHVGTGTVSANGWSVGDWIDAGEVIGLENDPGAASCGACDPDDRAYHLHWEVALANNPGDDLQWSFLGGFIQNGSRVPAVVCDIPGNELLAGESYTANPCENVAPTAAAGGPYSVDEGSTIVLDGTGSSDPDGNPLTYLWEPFEANDNMVVDLTLHVYDQVEALTDAAETTVTVHNVAPTVNLGADQSLTSGEAFDFEGSFTDPGVVDAPWSFTIEWGDGGAASEGSTNSQAIPIAESHEYCAAGTYTVSLSVTDKDGGVGSDDLELTVEYFSVGVDIKPDGAPNPVNLSGNGVIPVAILSSADFDATTIDPATLRLGDGADPDTPVATRPNGTYQVHAEDANEDGVLDLVVHVRVNELVANGDLTPTTTSLVVRGFLTNGCTNFSGEDAVTIVP